MALRYMVRINSGNMNEARVGLEPGPLPWERWRIYDHFNNGSPADSSIDWKHFLGAC